MHVVLSCLFGFAVLLCEMCHLQLADIQSSRFLAEFAKDLYQKQRKGEFQLGKAFEPLLLEIICLMAVHGSPFGFFLRNVNIKNRANQCQSALFRVDC